jgi:rubredoxin
MFVSGDVATRPYDQAVPTRYRCNACGNLTRFDVTVSRRTKAFHHFTVGGELTIEDEEVLSEAVDDVVCRWCGSGKAVEALVEVDEP